jgi:hypothetical protein
MTKSGPFCQTQEKRDKKVLECGNLTFGKGNMKPIDANSRQLIADRIRSISKDVPTPLTEGDYEEVMKLIDCSNIAV